jgi:hypothetical protein
MKSLSLSPVIETLMTQPLQLRRFDNRVFGISIILATVGSFVLSIAKILREPDRFQYDLKIYYNAPQVLAQGLDPYKQGDFDYPPIYLQIFRALSGLFTYGQFRWVFVFAQILSFAILLVIWKRSFLKATRLDVFAVFVWLGLYSPMLLDFQAGNVHVFETTLLFFAFFCFLKDRLRSFVFFTVLAASIKITPIFFLILLLLAPNRYGSRYFALGCVGFLAFGSLNLILFPELTKQFISYSIEIINNEQGLINPSSLAFIYETLSGSLAHLGLIPSSILINVIYVAAGIWIFWTISISWTSWRAWRLIKITDEGNNFTRSFLILFSILVYTLVMPRMKDYAYMIAIPSVLLAIERFEISVPRWILFLPLVLLSSGGARPALFQVLWDYYPLFVASFFWYLYVCELEKQSLQPHKFTRESSFELGVEPAPRT